MAATDVPDVIIVGSGAGGGMAAYALTQAVLTVVTLKSGWSYDPTTETPIFNFATEAPLHGAGTSDKPVDYFDANIGGYEVAGEGYAQAPGMDYYWWRARMLGGRTTHWGRLSLRMGPYDFRVRSRTGVGADWPIGYEPLAPWYERVAKLVGVTSGSETIENSPGVPAAIALPPPLRASEYFLGARFKALGIAAIATRVSILTRALGEGQACFYATECTRGCQIAANFQSPTVRLAPAGKTGSLTTWPGAHVHQVLLGPDGRASGVALVDRATGRHEALRARAVALAGSTVETARILLNSTNPSHPHGIGNNSGHVGRHLCDSAGVGALAYFPALDPLDARNDDGVSVPNMYVPWWGDGSEFRKMLDFAGGYQIKTWMQRRTLPDMGIGQQAEWCSAMHGAASHEELYRTYGSYFEFRGNGAMIPNNDCFVDLDSQTRDRFGIPVARFHWEWGEHEHCFAAHEIATYQAVVAKLGGRLLQVADGLGAGGGNHEVGTTRMGATEDVSVTNAEGQIWGIPNLIIADGGVFASSSAKNPTHTILALAWRSSAALAERARRGEA